ncbi:MAG: S1 RNA-binding domain-containing protein, partial [Parcubacteria group bacterium]
MTTNIKPVLTEMDKMLANSGHLNKIPTVGDSVKGTVISRSKKEVRLDIDGLLMGIVRGRELYLEAASFADLKVGDEVEATVIDLENEQGVLELSFRQAGAQKTWATLHTYQTENQTVSAVVKDANKGGLLVMLGNVPGFLPVSQLSPEYYPRVQGGDKMKILERLKSYVNKIFPVKVMDIREDEEKLIVSEKAAWEETQKDTLSQFKVG